MSNEKIIWDYLRKAGLSEYAVAGIMGNLYAESGLNSNILQVNFQSSLGMSSEQYTAAVNDGSYTNFIYDGAGYGLAQWTFWSRKQGLLSLAKEKKVSIGDLTMQLEFLCREIREFGLWDKLNFCRSVRDASNIMLLEFEKPYDTGTAVQNARAKWSQDFYDKYHNNSAVTVPVSNKVEMCGIMALMNLDKESAIKLAQSLREVGMTVSVFPVEC